MIVTKDTYKIMTAHHSISLFAGLLPLGNVDKGIINFDDENNKYKLKYYVYNKNMEGEVLAWVY